MLSAFTRAFRDLADPVVRRVLLKSLVLTLLIFAVAAVLIGWQLTSGSACTLGPLDRACELAPGAAGFGALLLVGLAAWFLFPAIALGVMGIFADEIVEAVEMRHYPDARGRPVPMGRSLAMSAGAVARLILWNLLAVPFYLLLLVTGVGPFLLFSLVNALALGRDLGEMVAARHFEGEPMKRWLAATRLPRGTLGLGAAWLFLIPFANLLAPLPGAAAATHMFHRGKK